MSRSGNGHDNAPIASWRGTLKTELVLPRRFQIYQQAIGNDPAKSVWTD